MHDFYVHRFPCVSTCFYHASFRFVLSLVWCVACVCMGVESGGDGFLGLMSRWAFSFLLFSFLVSYSK